jgi:hypothetical protein
VSEKARASLGPFFDKIVSSAKQFMIDSNMYARVESLNSGVILNSPYLSNTSAARGKTWWSFVLFASTEKIKRCRGRNRLWYISIFLISSISSSEMLRSLERFRIFSDFLLINFVI